MRKLPVLLSIIIFLSVAGCKKMDELNPPALTKTATDSYVQNTNNVSGYSLRSFQLKHDILKWEGQQVYIYRLEWNALGEATYLSNYEIQFSPNNSNYTTVGTVLHANVNTTTTHIFYINDYGYGYFRLKINLNDASTQFSNIVQRR